MSDEKLNFEVYQTMCGINEEKAKRTENCRECIYHGEHQDMGATIEVCNREEDLGKAVAACDNSAYCNDKLTLADVKKLKAERDAAVADLEVDKDCRFCKFYDKPIRVGMYCGQENCDCGESDKWEWRGAQNE